MKCQNCGKNEATFYYKSNINGRVMESHLCPQCARQLGLVQDMRRPMMSSFWDDDDFFTRPFRMLEPLLGGFGSRLLSEFPEPVDVTQQARRAAEEPREDNLVQGDEREKLSRQRQRIVLEGDIPSPMHPPKGCRFHTRCPYATDKCKEAVPEFKEHAPGHWAACHLLG